MGSTATGTMTMVTTAGTSGDEGKKPTTNIVGVGSREDAGRSRLLTQDPDHPTDAGMRGPIAMSEAGTMEDDDRIHLHTPGHHHHTEEDHHRLTQDVVMIIGW